MKLPVVLFNKSRLITVESLDNI